MSFTNITNQPYYNVFIEQIEKIEMYLRNDSRLEALNCAFILKKDLKVLADTPSYFPDCHLIFTRARIIEKAQALHQNLFRSITSSSVAETLLETIGKQCAILRNYGKLGSFLANLYSPPEEVESILEEVKEPIFDIAKLYKPGFYLTPLGFKNCNGNLDYNATSHIVTPPPAINVSYQDAINLLQFLNETELQNLCEVYFSNDTELKDISILSEHNAIKGNLAAQANVGPLIDAINAYNAAVKKELEELTQEIKAAIDDVDPEIIQQIRFLM